MHTLTITVPDDAREFIESSLKPGKFGNPSEFICHLLSEEQKRRAREHVEALLEEGLNSPAREMTPQDWAEMRRKLKEFVDSRNGT